MDPSEFEGTVTREDNVFDAGALLEVLFTPKQPKFICLDLSKDIGDLFLSIFNNKEALSKWNVVDFCNLTNKWDEQAIKIAELKEEYLSRRKSLANLVRTFTDKNLGSDNETLDERMKLECKSFIESFKSEFDFLAGAHKYAESSFLSAYKSLREIEDPAIIIKENLDICMRVQEAMKNSQEQLKNAESELSLHFQEGSAQSIVPLSNNADMLTKQHEEKIKQLTEDHAQELLDLRSRYENESRKREDEVRGDNQQ